MKTPMKSPTSQDPSSGTAIEQGGISSPVTPERKREYLQLLEAELSPEQFEKTQEFLSSLLPELNNEQFLRCYVQSKRDKAAARQRLKDLYGLEDDENTREFMLIEREQAQCAGCKGAPCQKTFGQYQLPGVQVLDGELKAVYRRCEVGLRMAFKSAVKRGGLPSRYLGKTFDNYEITADNERAVKMAKWFIDTQGQRSLYFYGECGTGKTFLAALIAKAFVKAMREAVFGDTPSLLEEIKRSFDTGGTEALFNRYTKCDLLVLDDVGSGKITDWTNDVLYRIVNDRYINDRPIIVTSNYDLKNLQRVLSKGDEFTGKRIVSRLAEMCAQGFLGTVDRRLERKS